MEDGFDTFFDTEGMEFLENLEKSQDSPTTVKEAAKKVSSTKKLLRDIKLDVDWSKDIEKYEKRDVTFSTLRENIEIWQMFYDKVKDLPEDLREQVDNLDLSLPSSDDLDVETCLAAYVRITNAQTLVTRYLDRVNTKHKYLQMGKEDFYAQALELMPGKAKWEKEPKANDLVFRFNLALTDTEAMKDYLEQTMWNIKSRLDSLKQIVYAIISERKQNVAWVDEHYSNNDGTQKYNKFAGQ